MYTQSAALTWIGRVLSGLTALGLTMSAAMKLTQAPELVANLAKYGFASSTVVPIGLTELACVVLYLIPQTALLGAMLIVGYLGGATAVHVSASEAPFAPILLGIVAVSGIALRDPRIRELVPMRRSG